MIKILTSTFFTYFIVTLITTVFSVFVKSVSRNDSHRSLKNEDFAIGLELSVTALILFIADILVVEIKGWWNTTSRDDDYIKLEDFTDQRGEYKYGLGVFLELNQDNCEPEYFVNKVKERNNAR